MPIEKREITETDEWLSWRKQFVTAHDVGALFGCHPFKTEADLYVIKAGVVDDAANETAVMRRGRMLQDVAARMFAEKHNNMVLVPNRHFFCDQEKRIGCTPDYMVENRKEIVETKVVGERKFKSLWLDQAGGNPQPELYILLQCMMQMFCTETQTAYVAALVIGDYTFELHSIAVPWHHPTWERIERACSEFWRRVDAREPPEFNYKRDHDLIKQLYVNAAKGTTVDWNGDNRIPELLSQRGELMMQQKAAELALEEVHAELRHKMAGADEALLNGWKITQTTVPESKVEYVRKIHRRMNIRKVER
jgi:putative phage-type endonuclease